MRHTVVEAPYGRIIRLYGDVDSQSAQRVREILLESVGLLRDVWLDLSDVNSIDSSGLSSLIEAHQMAQQNGVGLALVSVGSAVMEVLELARLDEIFTIQDALPEALGGG